MQSRAKRLSELTGIDHMQAEVHGNLSIAEIAKANQIGTELEQRARDQGLYVPIQDVQRDVGKILRSEEHTSELQSLMRISYAVFCLKNKIFHLCDNNEITLDTHMTP